MPCPYALPYAVCTVIFTLPSQDMLWLILARGLAGVGGGGIVNSVWTITTEIVPPRTKAKWSQALSVTWSASAVAGPILGGVFSGGHVSPLLRGPTDRPTHFTPASHPGEVATGFSWRWACEYSSSFPSVTVMGWFSPRWLVHGG